MAKKIVIENQRGVAPEFNLWTMEAVEEMLELFPEFKDRLMTKMGAAFRKRALQADSIARIIDRKSVV